MSISVIRGILLYLFISIILVNESEFSGAPAKAVALTEEQRKEIQKLREELNQAFEDHEDDNVAAAGVVVQPEWTKSAGKSNTKETVKVKVTAEGRKEAERLRAEINQAVKGDKYVASVDGNSKDYAADVKSVVEELGGKTSAGGKSTAEAKVSASSPTEYDPEQLGGGEEEQDDGPNIVEALADMDEGIDINKLQKLEVSKRRHKEMLILKLVEEDYSFDLGEDVLAWAHIMHAGREYFIGRRHTDLVIINNNNGKYERGIVLNVGQPITYVETYSFWNLHQQQQEGVILVASGDKVLWYRGNNETGQIDFYWEWVVGKAISGLTYFTTEHSQYLAVSSTESSRSGYYALNIYQFELEGREFWIAQRLQLPHPCSEVTLLDTGRDLVLAVPQNNTAAIYTFNPHADSTDHIRFQLRREVHSEDIQAITAFEMGGRKYLGLGGQQPQILLYQQGDFVPKTILGNNFGTVEFFFPIPARTYRDDLILLIQHRVEFATHNLTVLETLIWNGDSFEASIPVPCQMGDHLVHGVSCMLDIQRDEGLKGASLLRRQDEIFVIVPRYQAESGLFRLHFELLAKNSELLDLQDIFEFLKDWVKEQDDLLARAEEFLQAPDGAASFKREPDFRDLKTLKAPEIFFNGQVGEIYVNDQKWTDEDTVISASYLTSAIEQLGSYFNGPLHRRRREVEEGELHFSTFDVEELEVQELLLENLNSHKFYIQNGSLNFEGILSLDNLEVLEEASIRETRQAVEEVMTINGDLEFEEINGEKWENIVNNLVFPNESLSLPSLKVEGDVVVEDELLVDVLNSLNFPADFLWSSGPSSTVVHAEKVFAGNLSANAVDTEGLINGVDPMDAITLSDAQTWEGTPTFAHLEVSEKLELNGTVKMPGAQEFPTNPTLQEANNITASCLFKHLEVEGPIFVGGKFGQESLDEILSDLVPLPQDPAKEIIIPSKKTFLSTVTFPVDFNVEDGKVNNVQVEDFVTVDTEQHLNVSVLEGYMYFKNLTISGLFNGVDIKDLAENTIKIDEPQSALNTQLNFAHDIEVEDIDVRLTLNSLPLEKGLQTTEEDLYMAEGNFEHVAAKVAHIPNGVTGTEDQAQLNGVDLRSFLEERSWNAPSDTGNIFLDELTLEQGLQTDELHGINARYLLGFLQQIDDLPEMILKGQIQVDHIVATGNVQVRKLNNREFTEDILSNAIWLNRPNYLTSKLEFSEPLEVEGDLFVEGNFNGRNLPELIADMVFRLPNGSVDIRAPKSFLRDVEVLGNTHLLAINGVPYEFIGNRLTMNNFNGSLHINGNLIVNELEVTGHLDDFDMKDLSRLVRYDSHWQAFILLGQPLFLHPQNLDDLTVLGNLNELSRVSEFFEDLVDKNGVCILKGSYTFTGRADIAKGAYIRQLNGLDLLNLFENVIFVRGDKPVEVNGPVVFAGEVKARSLTSEGHLKAKELNQCSLLEWLTNTLRVDQPQRISRYLHFAPGSLDGNHFDVRFLNDLDLNKVITLHTEQYVADNLLFSEVYLSGKIQVKGPINNVDLQQEYANTLMTYGDQHVSTPLTMQSIEVLGNLEISGLVNRDKNLSEVATLTGPLQFESPLFFRQLSVPQVYTKDELSGIEFDKWHNNTLRLKGPGKQWVTGNWTVRSLHVKSGPELPKYVINGMSALDFVRRLPRQDRSYEEICHKVLKYLKKQRTRGYFIKHLERGFDLSLAHQTAQEQQQINKVFELSLGRASLLLINVGCQGHLYAWNVTRQVYEDLNTSFATGLVEKAIAIEGNKDAFKFATLSQGSGALNCSAPAGLSILSFRKGNISRVHHSEVEVKDIHVKASNILTIASGIVREISTNDYEQLNVWKLPHNSTDDTPYRFVPQSDGLINNGHNIFLLNYNSTASSSRDKRSQPVKYSLPLSYQRMVRPLTTKSMLQPNTSAARKLTFEDFKIVVERILVDLVYRLHLEVNITQLSIPETDLYDDHLILDFMAIMEELEKQKIFPADMFAQLNMYELEIPENPAQILAARTVQMIWPTIVEIEEVHRYLKDSENHQHPVCACITNYLGVTIRDVMLLANKPRKDIDPRNKNNYYKEMMAVIERIRQFQKQLEAIIAELNAEIKEELDILDLDGSESESLALSLMDIMNSEVANGTNAQATNTTWNIVNDQGISEMLHLEVGPSNSSHSLLAIVATSQPHLTAGRADFIRLFRSVFDNNTNHLFQSIPSIRASSLVSLRLREETLLAYVEECCSVHVLIYRGVQGFVPFGKFKTSQPIQHLMALSLPSGGHRERYFLVTVLRERLVFYEFVVDGLRAIPALTCSE